MTRGVRPENLALEDACLAVLRAAAEPLTTREVCDRVGPAVGSYHEGRADRRRVDAEIRARQRRLEWDEHCRTLPR